MLVLRQTQLVIAFAALVICLFSGCGGKGPDQLHRDALQAEQSASEARTRNDAKQARRAAEEAARAVTRLKKLAEANPQRTEETMRMLGEAETAARAAREQAEIAQAEHERRDALGSLRFKWYQKSRPVLVGTLLRQLASAAEAAGKLNTNESPAVISSLAKQGWELVSLIGAAEPLPDGSPDWAGANAQLLTWSTNQPIEFRVFLSFAFLSVGQGSLAMAEFEAIDPTSLEDANAMAYYRVGRTILYIEQGWNHLAVREVALFNELSAPTEETIEGGRFIVAALHALMAYEAGKKREFARMDAEIAQVIRAWPDSPFVVYLTGEKLAATGEWEKAATSLEASAAGTKDEWVAKQIAERARELRDGRGSTKAFALDVRFLIPFIARGVAAQGENVEVGKKITKTIEQAKAFGTNLRDRFALPGGNESSKLAEAEPSAGPD